MTADYSIYVPGKRERGIFFLCLFLAAGAISFLFYGTILGVFLVPLLARGAEKAYKAYRAETVRNRILVQFRDFLYSLSASFSTGRHMREAMDEAKESLTEVYGPEGEMVRELADMLRRMEETGDTDLSVLASFAARTHLDDIESFVEVFRTFRESGGDFVAGIGKAAAVIGEKIAIEREIHTIIAQKKLEGYIITAMPAVIILFMQVMSPEYFSVMYETLAGRILMTLALCAQIGAYMMIERITGIEI